MPLDCDPSSPIPPLSSQVKPAVFGDIPFVGSDIPSWNCVPSQWCGEYDYGPSFFSFGAGPVHFIFLNAYTYSNESSAQYNWLMEDLDAVDRKMTPWVIVFIHCPW